MEKSTTGTLYEDAIFVSLKLNNMFVYVCVGLVRGLQENMQWWWTQILESWERSVCSMFLSIMTLSPDHCWVACSNALGIDGRLWKILHICHEIQLSQVQMQTQQKCNYSLNRSFAAHFLKLVSIIFLIDIFLIHLFLLLALNTTN